MNKVVIGGFGFEGYYEFESDFEYSQSISNGINEAIINFLNPNLNTKNKFKNINVVEFIPFLKDFCLSMYAFILKQYTEEHFVEVIKNCFNNDATITFEQMKELEVLEKMMETYSTIQTTNILDKMQSKLNNYIEELVNLNNVSNIFEEVNNNTI